MSSDEMVQPVDCGEPDSLDFQSELCSLLNLYNKEGNSNTPDWILRNYIINALNAFNSAVVEREKWYGRV